MWDVPIIHDRMSSSSHSGYRYSPRGTFCLFYNGTPMLLHRCPINSSEALLMGQKEHVFEHSRPAPFLTISHSATGSAAYQYPGSESLRDVHLKASHGRLLPSSPKKRGDGLNASKKGGRTIVKAFTQSLNEVPHVEDWYNSESILVWISTNFKGSRLSRIHAGQEAYGSFERYR